MITPISKGGNRGSKSFNPMSRATRLVSSRAGPLTTLVTGHAPSPQHRLFRGWSRVKAAWMRSPILLDGTRKLGKVGFPPLPEATSLDNHHSEAPTEATPRSREKPERAQAPHLHAVVALPRIGHEQHDLPLGQLPARLPVRAALELLGLLLGFLPDPGSALPATPDLPVLLLPGPHGSGGLRVPGHGGQTGKTRAV